MRITTHIFTDGFYQLTTSLSGGRKFSITYSPKTEIDDGIADFKQQVREKLKADRAEAARIAPVFASDNSDDKVIT